MKPIYPLTSTSFPAFLSSMVAYNTDSKRLSGANLESMFFKMRSSASSIEFIEKELVGCLDFENKWLKLKTYCRRDDLHDYDNH